MGKLDNKIAVVTGASKGIRAASAKRLAAEGASVVVNYQSSKEGADKVVSERGHSARHRCGCFELTGDRGLFAQTKATYGKLDILVNNAWRLRLRSARGGSRPRSTITNITSTYWN